MPYQTPDDLGATDDFGFEQFQKLRDAILAAVHTRQPIGGSRLFTVQGTGYQDAHNAVPISVPDSESAGATYKVDVWLKCADPGTTITPRLRNITDASDEDIGAAADDTDWTQQFLTFTPVAGKEYRLQFVKSNDDFPCWGFGILQRTDS
jgi:hypothetical protein